ncbi:MAG: alpha/beta hydrolase [Rubrivivax sp.]|nr:alpha/beta hydrolase [Rubrivivax sp.]
MLDSQAAALIALMAERKVPPTHTLTPADARRMYLERRRFTQPDAPPVADVQAHSTDSGVPLRLYRPAGTDAATVLPVLVYFHGGGWTMGDLDTHDVLCRQLCNGAGVAVVAVDYRMGPEHRFPAAVDDSVEATRWVRAQSAHLRLDSTRMAVGGDSAGGNLAAVVALVLRDAADAAEASPLAFQLLIYPATDMRAVAPSHQRNGQGYVLTADTIHYFRGHYIADPAQWADWRASPLLATDHTRLPPALVLTAGYDPLVDEGRQYADKLLAAGTPCQYICFDRQIHGFVPMGRVLDEARTAVALCAAALKEALFRPAA